MKMEENKKSGNYGFELFGNLKNLHKIYDEVHLKVDELSRQEEQETQTEEDLVEFLQMDRMNARLGKENKGLSKRLVSKRKSNSKSTLKKSNTSATVNKRGRFEKENPLDPFNIHIAPEKCVLLKYPKVLNLNEDEGLQIKEFIPLDADNKVTKDRTEKRNQHKYPYDIDLSEAVGPLIEQLNPLDPFNIPIAPEKCVILNYPNVVNLDEELQIEVFTPLATRKTPLNKTVNNNITEERYNINFSGVVSPYIEKLMALEPLNAALNKTVFNKSNEVTPSEVIVKAFRALNELTQKEI